MESSTDLDPISVWNVMKSRCTVYICEFVGNCDAVLDSAGRCPDCGPRSKVEQVRRAKEQIADLESRIASLSAECTNGA
jgi:hypothetical protein